MSFSDDDEILDFNSPPTYNKNRIFSADEVPLAEMCFEIGHEDECINFIDETEICLNQLKSEASRLDKPISPIPHCKEDEEIPISDCGYSSTGSPFSAHDINENFDFLEPCFDLFPSLA